MAGFLARIVKSMGASLRNQADNDVFFFCQSGAPTNGTSGTGAGVMGIGAEILDTATGIWWENVGTKASPVWSASAGPTVIASTEVAVTSAQVKALRATPVSIIAAQGAGKVIEFIAGAAFAVYNGTNVFTNPQNLILRLKDTGGLSVSGAITAAGFLDQAASEYQPLVPAAAGAIATKANSDNQPLVLHNTGGSEITGNAGGDNTILIKVAYRVWQPVW